MTVIPAGSFFIGSPVSENGREQDEGPRVEIVFARPFALSTHEITFAEWDACVAGGGCNGYAPDDGGWGRGRMPVMNVSRDDATAYIAWLNTRAGAPVYRLPSEAEWEYAARAGTTDAFPWGPAASRAHANYGADECCAGQVSGADRWQGTAPVGSFPANAFGLFDMIGNVQEWVDDCYIADYEDHPRDGASFQSDPCRYGVIRGGSWIVAPKFLRPAYRVRYSTDERRRVIGIRVARTL